MKALNREELAWAAGFFDGEGTSRRRTKGLQALLMSVAQVYREPLDRFKTAVGGLGTVYGPYGPKTPGRRPYFVWSSGGFAQTQAVGAMLWNWLCSIKREQLKAGLVNYVNAYQKRMAQPRPYTARPVCYKGHQKDKVGNGKYLRCRECDNSRRRVSARKGVPEQCLTS